MAKFIHSDEIPGASRGYLTPGKKYEILEEGDSEHNRGGFFRDDNGDVSFARYAGSAHLNGDAWTVS